MTKLARALRKWADRLDRNADPPLPAYLVNAAEDATFQSVVAVRIAELYSGHGTPGA